MVSSDQISLIAARISARRWDAQLRRCGGQWHGLTELDPEGEKLGREGRVAQRQLKAFNGNQTQGCEVGFGCVEKQLLSVNDFGQGSRIGKVGREHPFVLGGVGDQPYEAGKIANAGEHSTVGPAQITWRVVGPAALMVGVGPLMDLLSVAVQVGPEFAVGELPRRLMGKKEDRLGADGT